MREQVEQKMVGAFVDILNIERPSYGPKNGAAIIPRVMVGFSTENGNGEGLAFHIGDSLSIFSAESYELNCPHCPVLF